MEPAVEDGDQGVNGNSEGEYAGGGQVELVAHYKARMKSMLPFMRHSNKCDHAKWQLADWLQTHYGTGYSAGPAPSCTCGAAALVAIVKAEVGE